MWILRLEERKFNTVKTFFLLILYVFKFVSRPLQIISSRNNYAKGHKYTSYSLLAQSHDAPLYPPPPPKKKKKFCIFIFCNFSGEVLSIYESMSQCVNELVQLMKP